MEEQLFQAVVSHRIDRVRSILLSHPSLDLEVTRTWTALHQACDGGHVELVRELLAFPQVNVNQPGSYGATPFYYACETGKPELIKLLLKDVRVDVNLPDLDGQTPLWRACRYGCKELLKWLLLLRGGDLRPEKRLPITSAGRSISPLGVAKARKHHEEVRLLERFVADPAGTRNALRVEMGVVEADAAELFATMVFLCDDYLNLNLNLKASSARQDRKASRFFVMSAALPMELQMILCHNVFGSARENIHSRESEAAFKRLAKALAFSEKAACRIV